MNGGGYATPADILASAPSRLVAHLTGSSEPSDDALTKALESAAGDIDSYLSNRYALPLPSVPLKLRDVAIDIALYKLLRLRPLGDIDDTRKRYEDAIRFLERVSEGKVGIGLPTAEEGTEPEPMLESTGVDYFTNKSVMKGLDY